MKYRLCTILLTLALAACGAKEKLGVGRHSPDEFTVIKRAPLTLPPDYSLRAPAEGEAPADQRAAYQARAVLMGENQPATAGAGDEVLLQKLGTHRAETDIRAQISRDNGFIALQNRTVADKLIFWQEGEGSPEDVPASEVDAKAEAERLKKSREEGTPLNEGDVPVIEKKQSTLDKLF